MRNESEIEWEREREREWGGVRNAEKNRSIFNFLSR